MTSSIARVRPALVVQEASPGHADACARIAHDAFESIARRHDFPVESRSEDALRMHFGQVLGSDGFVGLVAIRGGRVLGSALIDERSSIAGIGPVTVDPTAQDDGVGRSLMEAALDREQHRGAPGVRLVQTAYHYRSLALYAKLGFVVREPLSVIHGAPPAGRTRGRKVRAALERDGAACDRVCVAVHGHDRQRELRQAIAAGTARVVERGGVLSGYATGFGYGFHAAAESVEDLIALIASTRELVGLGMLVPSRNTELLRWCLHHDLQIVQQSTLMTIGLYNEPAGAWLPSVIY